MQLPTKKVRKNESGNPKLLVVFGKPKSGKTELASYLDDALIVNFEKKDGTEFVECAAVTVRDSDQLKDLYKSLKAKNAPKYKYIVLDTATAMVDLAVEVGLTMYKKTAIRSPLAGCFHVTICEGGAAVSSALGALGFD